MLIHNLTQDTESRLLEERHAEELTNLTDRNREHLRAWLPWVDATRTLEDRKTFIRGALEQFARNQGFVAGIWHEDRLAGVIGYDPIDWENRSTELGYWLGEDYQGKGLVSAASATHSRERRKPRDRQSDRRATQPGAERPLAEGPTSRVRRNSSCFRLRTR